MSVRILVTEPDLVQEAVLRQLIALGEVKSASDGGEVDVLWTGLSKRIDQGLGKPYRTATDVGYEVSPLISVP